jgi:hypothetical protein
MLRVLTRRFGGGGSDRRAGQHVIPNALREQRGATYSPRIRVARGPGTQRTRISTNADESLVGKPCDRFNRSLDSAE